VAQFSNIKDDIMIGNFGFDLKSLEIFVSTVDAGNMTIAAEKLGTTQSAVSQNLANLEKSLEAQLLDRTVRPIEVTTAGRFLYDSAQQMLKQAAKTSQDMRQTNFNHLNHVNIAMVDSLVNPLGTSLVTALKKHTSTWSIHSGLSHRHANALLSRHVDMIISDDAMEEHPELMRFPILREPFILVLPKDQPVDSKHLHKLLNNLGFIRYTAASLIGIRIENYLKRISLEPQISLRLDNTFAILSSVSAGLGWSITTPLSLFNTGIDMANITCLPLPQEPLYRNITLVTRNNKLWELPAIIAKDSRNILNKDFNNFIQEHMPWLEGQINIG